LCDFGHFSLTSQISFSYVLLESIFSLNLSDEFRHLELTGLGGNDFIETPHDRLKLGDIGNEVHQLIFKLADSRQTPLIKFLEVIVNSKSAKVTPNTTSFFTGKLRIQLVT
jgi:hypothetical protein